MEVESMIEVGGEDQRSHWGNYGLQSPENFVNTSSAFFIWVLETCLHRSVNPSWPNRRSRRPQWENGGLKKMFKGL